MTPSPAAKPALVIVQPFNYSSPPQAFGRQQVLQASTPGRPPGATCKKQQQVQQNNTYVSGIGCSSLKTHKKVLVNQN